MKKIDFLFPISHFSLNNNNKKIEKHCKLK